MGIVPPALPPIRHIRHHSHAPTPTPGLSAHTAPPTTTTPRAHLGHAAVAQLLSFFLLLLLLLLLLLPLLLLMLTPLLLPCPHCLPGSLLSLPPLPQPAAAARPPPRPAASLRARAPLPAIHPPLPPS